MSEDRSVDLGRVGDEVLSAASYAPFAGFFLVAAADGVVDPSELQTFVEQISACEDPVLMAVVHSNPQPLQQRVDYLVAHRELIPASLHAMGKVFRAAPAGAPARRAFLELLELVAEADGRVVLEEERSMNAITKFIDAEELPEASNRGMLILLVVAVVLLGMVGLLAWMLY